MNIAGRIKTDALHDQALYELMTKEILANQIYAAMSVADQFNSSAYKAKAFPLIARIQTDSALQPLANENFKRALAFANDLSSQPQAVALSEIARYHTLRQLEKNNPPTLLAFLSVFDLVASVT